MRVPASRLLSPALYQLARQMEETRQTHGDAVYRRAAQIYRESPWRWRACVAYALDERDRE